MRSAKKNYRLPGIGQAHPPTYVEALMEKKGDPGKPHGFTRRFIRRAPRRGRLSSTDPNLQKHSHSLGSWGPKQSAAPFVAESGFVLLSADYSQIDLARGWRICLRTPVLIETFKRGGDIHAATAAEVFSCGNKRRLPRKCGRRAKAINFGVGLWPASLGGFLRGLGISVEEADDFHQTLFCPLRRCVKKWIEGDPWPQREKKRIC